MARARDILGRVFARLGRDNVTGLSAMVAYNLAISLVPFSLLALWIAGQLVQSPEFESAIRRDLMAIFPGPADSTLDAFLTRVQRGAAGAGLLALLFSIWTGMSFWGAIDTCFERIYSLPSRGWLKQKRFAFLMLWLFMLFIAATIAVPAAQSALAGVRRDLPFGLADVPGLTLATSLAIGVALLFLTLWAIYALGPNGRLPWRAVFPGAVLATAVIALLDLVYPYYLTNASSVWRFGTTFVFLVIVLAWFYAVSLVILLGAEINAALLRREPDRAGGRPAAPEPGEAQATDP
ncbi:MAG: YihY/virulence factor BrkB family protein [Actinomycetes bacterium]